MKIFLAGGEDVHMRLPRMRKLRDLGHQVAAIGSGKADAFRKDGFVFYPYSLKRNFDLAADWQSYRELTEIFRREQPDIVHAFDTKPCLLVPFAARKAGIRGVFRTITGMGRVFSRSDFKSLCLRFLYCRLHRLASRRCTMTFFQNRDDLDYFLRRGMVKKEKTDLIPGSGIDMDEVRRVKPSRGALAGMRDSMGTTDRIVVIMMSRLTEEKGVREYVEAAKILQRHSKVFHFLLAGGFESAGHGGISRREIEEVSDCVHYLGSVSNPLQLLYACDIAVLPTRYREGIPRSLLEAMAVGLPVVTTDMPGCRDAVRDGENGYLIPPSNPFALADAIRKLAGDGEEKRKIMGEKGRQRVEKNMTLSHIVEQTLRHYEKVVRL